MACLILSGTPIAGFTAIGPFSHPALAQNWAEAWEEDIDWWVVPFADPKELEVERTETT